VPEKDRLAEAVVWGLCEGAGASDGAAAIVKPVSRDVPVGNLCHEDLQTKKSDRVDVPTSFDHLVARTAIPSMMVHRRIAAPKAQACAENTTGEMRSERYFAQQQSSGPNVRFGS
jgi:hypothetical protein